MADEFQGICYAVLYSRLLILCPRIFLAQCQMLLSSCLVTLFQAGELGANAWKGDGCQQAHIHQLLNALIALCQICQCIRILSHSWMIIYICLGCLSQYSSDAIGHKYIPLRICLIGYYEMELLHQQEFIIVTRIGDIFIRLVDYEL